MTDSNKRKSLGCAALACAAMNLYVTFADPKLSGDRWPRSLVAVLFCLVGLPLVTAATRRISSLMPGFACVCFSCLGWYVAFSHGGLEGGIPFLPATWNQTIGHALFAFGAVVTGSAAVYFFIRTMKSGKSE